MSRVHTTTNPRNFDSIRISIASPKEILAWSHGEVTKPETINYRTFKPERDGLFCTKIFGPIKDYECLCGRYKRMKYRGTICEKCGTEVTLAKVRRERMGHIELASPVAHTWFTKSLPSRVGLLLDLTLKQLEKVLYFENYIVIEAGLTPLALHQLLTKEEYEAALDQFGEEAFSAGIGARALRNMLEAINLEAEHKRLHEALQSTPSELKRKKIIKTLKLVEGFIVSKTRPEWMILTHLPVMPPELRPLVPLDGGRFATSDLNDLYRRVINRNNRLKRLQEYRAPLVIIRNEERMLQESVDALLDNGRRGRILPGANKRPLKSISDTLKGKQGRFRQNLLGKRVDYSGRSVIVVGPNLKLHQCGLPKKMALELFKPFVYSRLEKYGVATNIKAAKRMVEKERPEVWEILAEVIREHTVLLNRAPTLHRLGIQAFEPVLISGKAIQLHPLVCTAFNADFDGDQMAVHVPLSLEAQLEARVLMMSSNNILSPSSGKPIIVPSKDIVVGLYYLTLMRENEVGEGKRFASAEEIEHAMFTNNLSLHAKIIARYESVDEHGKSVYKIAETTVGRLKLYDILPRHHKLDLEVVNKLITNKELAALFEFVYRCCGQKDTVVFADKVMALGFYYSAKSGISFGKDDLVIPGEKQSIVSKTLAQVAEFEQQYQDGLITQGEEYNKVIDAWSKCSDLVADAMMKSLSKVKSGTLENSVYMMAHSGARGSAAQLRQLSGMRGSMSTSSGKIMKVPVISSFIEGLSVHEYFISTHGARKGMSDTALRTANSGYLTRRLVDVAQDCIIRELDCGTSDGLVLKAVLSGEEIVASLSERMLGRVAARDILNPESDKVIVKAGEEIIEDHIPLIESAGVEQVYIRSPLTCATKHDVCAKCYGRDLSRGRLVNIGEAVGVIAAQSIGEPGTQLTMNTFHIGGAVQRRVEQSTIDAINDGQIKFNNLNTVINTEGAVVVMSRYGEIIIVDQKKREKARHRVPYGARILVKENDAVNKGAKLVEWDPYTIPIISENDGFVTYNDLIEGISVREIVDEDTGITNRVVVEWKQLSSNAEIRPRLTLRDAEGKIIIQDNGLEANYLLSVDAILSVENGQGVKSGDTLARVPRESSKNRDITGGLPRVSELLEARRPKECAIISEVDGRVEFGKDYKNKRRITIIPNDKTKTNIEYLIPKWRHVLVQEGDYVKCGDIIIDGSQAPHDILQILGVEALATYLVKEIQDVYRLQGVRINDKHIEVIVKQMLQKIEITDPGDSHFLVGEQVMHKEFDEANAKIEESGGKLASARPVLQGITRAALQTQSFISAASFIETTRVLTEAAVSGKVDYLTGLKENVIVGRLIPAGTGAVVNRLRKIAFEQDREAQKRRLDDTTSQLKQATMEPRSEVKAPMRKIY